MGAGCPSGCAAYRFEHAGRRVIFSGDTALCDALVRCARGADLLVQDACATQSRRYADARSRRIRDLLIGFHGIVWKFMR
jgi:ribonuclease BN (tRNA processing enzyme)